MNRADRRAAAKAPKQKPSPEIRSFAEQLVELARRTGLRWPADAERMLRIGVIRHGSATLEFAPDAIDRLLLLRSRKGLESFLNKWETSR